MKVRIIQKLMVFALLFCLATLTFGCNASRKNINNLSNDGKNFDNHSLDLTTAMNSGDDKHTNVIEVTPSFDSLYNFADINVLAKQSDYIALITVDTVLGVSNVNKITNEHISTPYTYGKVTVLKTLKGEFNEKEIKFCRLGGQLPYKEWIKGDEDPKKLESVRAELGMSKISDKDIVIEYRIKDDIKIEEGKTYLAFMYHNPDFNEQNEYVIHGYQFGLRETEVEQNVSKQSIGSIQIKNNDTGNWERISSVLPDYCK